MAPISEADRATLVAVAAMDEPDESERDIVTGALTCDTCAVYYPVHNGVPRMLPYRTRAADVHAKDNAGWIREHLAGFRLPSAAAPPGEEGVLRNFSTEWTEYKWTGDSYWNTTPGAMLANKRYELGVPRHRLTQRLVLEVGIGIGGTADALSRAEACEIVGMDLSYAVDQARHYFGHNPLLHIVQASVFAPPFRPETFDVVYSHGVLHHTYSTRAAFGHVAKLPKRSSGMLYVWLYSHEQERATFLRRTLMMIEQAVRPIASRLPTAAQTLLLLPTLPFYVLYQNIYGRSWLGGNKAARYGWNEALHAARDRLTPPFAYRHSYEEVMGWFRAEHYTKLELLRDETPPADVPVTYPLNVGIRGFARNAGAAE